MGINANYKVPDGAGGFYDIGLNLVEKSYLIDRYPELADTFRFAGLWGWGKNSVTLAPKNGYLGDNTLIHRSSPVQTIAGGANWKQIGSGGGALHVAAIKTDGTLWLWGYNVSGGLGTNDTTSRSSPVQTIAGGTNWKQVAMNSGNTAAIKTDGTLWLWGANTGGGLGNNTITAKSSPVQTIAGGTNWKQVACGGDYTAAIKTDGTLWSWGNNAYGQLGDNTITNKSSPVQTIAGGTNWKQVACSSFHAAAIKSDGTLWLWGNDQTGQLGNNVDFTSFSSPIQTIAGGTNWKQVAVGGNTTAAIKTDGTLWLWGANSNGMFGDNTITNRSSPVQTIASGTNWKAVSVGGAQTAAIKTDGTLWLWGYNLYGQLGDGGIVKKSSPVQTIAGGANWKQVQSITQSVLAIRDDSEDLL